MTLVVTIALLVLPVIAVKHSGVNFQLLGSYWTAVSVLTYWIYAVDKRRAEEEAWRVPEAWWHLLEIAGGWPGAFLAQRQIRHKCSKVSYQLVFWMIVLIYQFVALNSLRDWDLSKAAADWFEGTSVHRR